MSPDDESLREMARNRGCTLVKSRVRTPGRKDYGRFGLKDAATGKALFGFGKRGLTATPEDIETFLRGGAAASWKGSIRAVPPGRRTRREAEPEAAPKPKPKAKAKPAPAPKRAIREARPKDSAALAGLIAALGYEVTEADVRRRLARLRNAGRPTLVATLGEAVVGCLTLSMMEVLHRPRPVGRISMLVVSEEQRGAGIGTDLVAAAEAWFARAGCGLVEVTSNVKRSRAHAFYERLGYERTSYRFAKAVA
ncbi:hypothetical protein GCM10023232_19670 [Sphingosinicella ginsenosidimutans]|uniref:GNAT family N-acetyltransferase n=1 Tax=Allosphingosinicella ginsenosidimutans TaxID=1176539 RepID=A0A5C6TRY1_9SPHN|nr:GNAT family N-acetyltransferase [Sphingosinicella ginsenosidimutans]TXC62996.1 GNAT family N-acetyltransferase [Sphingosinicella ginsenosidimutans]